MLLLWVSVINANNTNAAWEETVRTQLNQVIGSESFSFAALKVDTANKKLNGEGTFFGKSGIGFEVLYQSDQQIGSFKATFPDNSKVSISSRELKNLTGQNLEDLIPDALKKSVYLEAFSFSISKETKKVENCKLFFNTFRNWEMLQSSGMSLDQIKVVFGIQNPTEKDKREFQGRLTGHTKINGKSVLVSADLKKDKESLQLSGVTGNFSFEKGLQSIVGRSDINGLDIPDNIVNLKLEEATLTFAPYQDWVSLSGNSNFGIVNIWAKQNGSNKKDKMAYVVTISPPKDFKISKLNENFASLDRFDLGNKKIVISSEDKNKKETSKIPSLAQIKSGIKKGANLIAKIDLTKIKMDQLLGIKELVVNSTLSKKLEHVTLEGNLETNVQLGPTAQLEGVVFRLKPSPRNFAISLLGVMSTKIEDDALKFKGGVEIAINDQSLNFLAMMQGDWNNPLGAKGLTMSNVGMQMGSSFTTAPVILPNMALTGEVKIGDFNGAATLAFDSRNPTKSMMAVSFSKIVMMDLLDLVIDPKVSRKIPKDMKKMLKTMYLKDVEMEVVPQDLQVLEKNYVSGFRAAGILNIGKTQGEAALDISYDRGIMMRGAVDPIDLKIFKLRGVNGQKGPSLLIDLRKGGDQKVAINGLINILGLEAHTDLELMPKGFSFEVGGKIFNVFNGKIHASGKDIHKAGDMELKVHMENDLLGFFEREVIKFVENGTKESIKNLTKAQKTVTNWQSNVKKLNKDIKKMVKKVDKEQASDRKKIAKAKANVSKAQKTVDGYSKKINSLTKQIKRLKKHQVPTRVKLEAQRATIFGYQKTAKGGLKAAQLFLKGLKHLNTNPEADIRVINLRASQAGALKSLDGAKAFLEGLKKTIGFSGDVVTFVVDKGTDAMINVKKVDFQGKLNKLSSGAVKLNMEIEWLGKKKKMKLAFDFHDPKKAALELAKKLVKK